MEIPLTIILPVVTAVVGVTTWNVSLHGRVTGHDQLFEERKVQADERHDDVKKAMERFEEKLDRVLLMKR